MQTSGEQCWTCVGVVADFMINKREMRITIHLTKPRDNPFKFKSGPVETGESRKFDRTGKTQHKRKFKQNIETVQRYMRCECLNIVLVVSEAEQLYYTI